MSKEKHVHKLRRHIYKSSNIIFFCMLPDCSFKIAQPLALGKRSICHRCGQEFIMNEYSIRLAKPHCMDCHKSKSDSKSEPEPEKTYTIPAMDSHTVPLHIDKQIINPLEELKNRMQAITTKEDEEI